MFLNLQHLSMLSNLKSDLQQREIGVTSNLLLFNIGFFKFK